MRALRIRSSALAIDLASGNIVLQLAKSLANISSDNIAVAISTKPLFATFALRVVEAFLRI